MLQVKLLQANTQLEQRHLQRLLVITSLYIRYFFPIQMIPVLASFAFHDCSETIWESEVIFAERHFTFAVQWAPLIRTRPPIAKF